MKIAFIAGHSNKKTGASGNGYQEHLLARELADMCVKLANERFVVEAITDTKDMHSGGGEEDFIKQNLTSKDYFMSIHFNSATAAAKGSEIIVNAKEKSTKIEDRILDRLNKLGFVNRGVKRRVSGGQWVEGYSTSQDYYGILREPMTKGIHGTIMEVCFISNKSDMDLYQKHKKEIATIIVDEICSGFGLKAKVNDEKIEEATTMYRVCVGSYSVFSNAERRKKEMLEKGFDAYIVVDTRKKGE
jgi:N-acetylmuramoyl-L-alanine amidase